MEIKIGFPGGLKVDASIGKHTVTTDQPDSDGGTGSAPSPFVLFLASLGTCAGFYVLRFCQQRGIPTDGLYLTQKMELDPSTHSIMKVSIVVHLPPGFPEKYREAVIRAADQCAVKRTIAYPPEIEVVALG